MPASRRTSTTWTPGSSMKSLFHLPRTFDVHHAELEWLHELMVDLDAVRLGKEPSRPVDIARLEEWQEHNRRLSECLLDPAVRSTSSPHDEGRRLVIDLLVVLYYRLICGEPLFPGVPETWFDEFERARADLRLCQEDLVEY